MSILTKFFYKISNNQCQNCHFAKEAFFEFCRKTQEQNEQYARVVASIGYVSYITILTIPKVIFQNSNIIKLYFTSIIAIAVSLALFVSFEIWKAKSTIKYESALMEKFLNAMDNSPNFSLSNLKDEIIKTQNMVYTDITKATKWIFLLSVICALISAFFFLVSIGIFFSNNLK